MSAVRALLAGAVDYAGLFPPASLEMPRAVSNYAEYRAGADAWALGRFVVPVARLDDLLRAAAPRLDASAPADPWRLSALIGSDVEEDARLVTAFNARARARGVIVDAVELKAASSEEIARTVPALPSGLEVYVEIPLAADPTPYLQAMKRAGARAKARTGGVTRDAFPSADELARFIESCVHAGVPFKATAGLHHPIRADYRLTYASDAPTGRMFGFLNVFLAAAFLRAAIARQEVVRVLEETERQAFRFEDDGVYWRGHHLATADVAEARRETVTSFGSCSFEEPIADLRALQLV